MANEQAAIKNKQYAAVFCEAYDYCEVNGIKASDKAKIDEIVAELIKKHYG